MAGLPWFALYADFPDHPKTIRLAARLQDPNAGMYMVRLMTYCARFASSGVVESDLVEHVCAWTGQRGLLLEVMTEVGFLTKKRDAYEVHGWVERNKSHADKFSRDAKRVAGNKRGSRKNPAREKDGIPADPARQTDSQTDIEKEKNIESVLSRQPPLSRDPRQAGPENRLMHFRTILGERLGLPKMLDVGTDPARVVEVFERQLAVVGEEQLLLECIDLAAKSKNGTPGTLKWFVGWLERLPLVALNGGKP